MPVMTGYISYITIILFLGLSIMENCLHIAKHDKIFIYYSEYTDKKKGGGVKIEITNSNNACHIFNGLIFFLSLFSIVLISLISNKQTANKNHLIFIFDINTACFILYFFFIYLLLYLFNINFYNRFSFFGLFIYLLLILIKFMFLNDFVFGKKEFTFSIHES